jgi:cytochrome c-L
MAWVRSVYWGSADKADWLTEEQKANFEPAEVPEDFKEAMDNFNKTHH